jgi:hypothetical protein
MPSTDIIGVTTLSHSLYIRDFRWAKQPFPASFDVEEAANQNHEGEDVWHP